MQSAIGLLWQSEAIHTWNLSSIQPFDLKTYRNLPITYLPQHDCQPVF